MALSLSAEQKNLKALFINDDKYKIPAFQRPYSWTEDEAIQLYYDVTTAFQSGDDYFLGNIILAKSRADKSVLEVIDGQQRMITLWLALKVLSVLMPSVPKLRSMIELDSWEDDDKHPKIEWESDDDNDNDNAQLTALMSWTNEDFEQQSRPDDGRLFQNARLLYKWLKDYISKIGEDKVSLFRKYFTESLYLLPIELSGETADDAQNKALTIFETINNRGLDLQDADIFKARLFNMARQVGQSDLMRNRWDDLVNYTRRLSVSVDEIFRYYSHIIRGRQSITSNEKRLRDFYTLEPYSPFKTMSFTEILDELFRVADVISQIEEIRRQTSRTAAWLQVLETYTNRYPMYALVAYLFQHQKQTDVDKKKLDEFMQKMIRFCYLRGSTTAIKFEVYSVIASIMNGYHIEDYRRDALPEWLIAFPGRTKAGLTLLAFYLANPDQGGVVNVGTDRILKSCDFEEADVNGYTLSEQLRESIANYMVTDIPRRYAPYGQRRERIGKSHVAAIASQLPDGFPTLEFFDKRLVEIEQLFVEFFTNERPSD